MPRQDSTVLTAVEETLVITLVKTLSKLVVVASDWAMLKANPKVWVMSLHTVLKVATLPKKQPAIWLAAELGGRLKTLAMMAAAAAWPARVPPASCSRATSASSLPRQHKSMSFTLATCVSTARELEVTTMEALAAAVAVAGETLAEAVTRACATVSVNDLVTAQMSCFAATTVAKALAKAVAVAWVKTVGARQTAWASAAAEAVQVPLPLAAAKAEAWARAPLSVQMAEASA